MDLLYHFEKVSHFFELFLGLFVLVSELLLQLGFVLLNFVQSHLDVLKVTGLRILIGAYHQLTGLGSSVVELVLHLLNLNVETLGYVLLLVKLV